MGFVQKIFYYHVPSALDVLSWAFVCAFGSGALPVQGSDGAIGWPSARPS